MILQLESPYSMGNTEAVVLKVYNHIILEKEDAATAVNEALNFWDKIETLGQKWDINNQ